MESSSTLNKVVSWSSHHRGPNHHLCSIRRLRVVHEGPDPEWSLIEWSKIITCHKFHSEGVVISLSFNTELIVGPLDAEIVYFRTPTANLILLVEICEFSAAMLLDLLSRTKLDLHFSGRLRVVTCVESVKQIIMILGNSHSVHHARSIRLITI